MEINTIQQVQLRYGYEPGGNVPSDDMSEFTVMKMADAMPQERNSFRFRDRRVMSTPFERDYNRRFPTQFHIHVDGKRVNLRGRY